jgi:hypothetical protein
MIINARKEFWALSVRQIHYALLNDPPLKNTRNAKSKYRNDQKSYKDLVNLMTRARLEGLVPWNAIADTTRPVSTWNVHADPRSFIQDELGDFLKGYFRDLMVSQPNHIEIVCEKNTIEPIIRSVAMDYTITVISGRGFCSLDPRRKMAERFKKSGKEKLIELFISDFDPDGLVIAESFARSMRDDFGIEDLVPVRVGLTKEQILAMDNPPTALPSKETSPNYKRFVAEHGKDCWELQAIPPKDLQQILRDAIDSVIDIEAFNAELDAEREDAVFLEGRRRVASDAMKSLGA